VHGLKGRSFRLFKDNLDKEVIPAESKFVVKKNRVEVKLRKVQAAAFPSSLVCARRP
jgi:hypothetical protein